MILWIWRQIGLDLPADWEMLQFSRDPERGRCAFADRHRYRLELNWHRFKGEPDFDRMMKDYAASLESTWKDIKPVQRATWPGLTGKRQDEAVSRFGRYLPELGVLVEIVFIHLNKRDESLEHNILKGVRAVPADGAGWQRWRAFGMDLRVPSSFALAECVIEPARIGLRFDGPKKPDRWIFRRYGMVASWLKVPMRDWLDQQADPSARNRRPETVTRGRYAIERINGDWKPRGLLLPRGLYASSLWQDPGDQRLYQAICITGKKNRAVHPAGGADEMLSSCPEFLVVPGASPR